jgi:RNA polymerase sigma factor (sigma-70 family)
MPETEHESDRSPAPQPSPPPGACAAFEETYLTYAPRLRKIAVAKFAIPRAEAETLVHDVFATYFMHARSVRAVEPYLIGAICNASRQWRRRSQAAEAVFCDEMPCMAAAGAAAAEEIERKLLLSRMLARIGRRCRELLHRYYVSGESTQAIACALESTPGSILVQLHKCRRRALGTYRAMSERA